jgi:peptidylprolyl isomerase
VIKLKTLFSTPRRIPVVLSLAGLLAAAVLAGCGSGGSSTITVGNENSSDNTLEHSTTKEKEPSETSSNEAKTPTTGPLSKKPVVTSPGGTPPKKEVIKDLIVGTGAEAKAGQSVTVNYVGINWKSGKEFDSSWKRNEPFTFALGKKQVIPGWEKGIPGMKVGGRRELQIPPALAYGSKGSSSIPPEETLIFVVDLLGT